MWYSDVRPAWLAPFSFLYGMLMGLRNGLYRIGLRHRVRVNVPVIVVGNLTVGGTGKTPLVARACVGRGGHSRAVGRVVVYEAGGGRDAGRDCFAWLRGQGARREPGHRAQPRFGSGR